MKTKLILSPVLSAKHGFFLIEFYKKFIKKPRNKKKVMDYSVQSYNNISNSAVVNWITCCKMSAGIRSTKLYGLAVKSSVRKCSHKTNPVVTVRLSSETCSGKPLLVFVIGQTIAIFVFSIKRSLLTIKAGRYPACSCPRCGLKLTLIISPCLTILRFRPFLPSLLQKVHSHRNNRQIHLSKIFSRAGRRAQ